MDQIIRRLETMHRALRAAPENCRRDNQLAEAVAICLRDLHAIAAQAADGDQARPYLRLIDCAIANLSTSN